MIRRLHQNSGRAAMARVHRSHVQWVRGFGCIVKGCEARPIEAAHVRIGGFGGIGLKPDDSKVVPMCRGHHSQQHSVGETTFAKLYRLDLSELAAELARKSPHLPKLNGLEEA